MHLIAELIAKFESEKLARYIDHTLLKPEASLAEAERVISETKAHGFACAVLSPYHALYLAPKHRDVTLCSVIGFPMGYASTETKVAEAKQLLEAGVQEIDMVMNIQAFKSGDYEYVERDIASVLDIVKQYGAVLKVIIETGLLSDEEKVYAAKMVARIGAHFVKTCTGFLGSRATVHDVLLLKNSVEGKAKVKAAGGIRHVEDALLLIAAGAERIGTSTGTQIIREFIEIKRRL